MKSMITSLVFLLVAQMAQAKCGTEVVVWPSDRTPNCADQIYTSEEGAEVGETRIAIDPSHSASDAEFKCTARGWVLVQGTCTAEN